jgi:hypothetical protein
LKKQNLVAAIIAVILIAAAATVYLRLAGPAGSPAKIATADNRD